jgi:hypothetical protein
MPEIAIAVRAVVLGYRQVQHHEFIALAGMLSVLYALHHQAIDPQDRIDWGHRYCLH